VSLLNCPSLDHPSLTSGAIHFGFLSWLVTYSSSSSLVSL
ncbi:11703_t:CDS:1, partial [Dentiscutata erythropus]